MCVDACHLSAIIQGYTQAYNLMKKKIVIQYTLDLAMEFYAMNYFPTEFLLKMSIYKIAI